MHFNLFKRGRGGSWFSLNIGKNRHKNFWEQNSQNEDASKIWQFWFSFPLDVLLDSMVASWLTLLPRGEEVRIGPLCCTFNMVEPQKYHRQVQSSKAWIWNSYLLLINLWKIWRKTVSLDHGASRQRQILLQLQRVCIILIMRDHLFEKVGKMSSFYHTLLTI